MPNSKPLFSPDQQDMIRLFGRLFEGSQTIFGLKNREQCYVYVNNEFANVIGQPVDKIIGKKADEFILPSSTKALYQHQESVMTTGVANRFVDQIGVGSRTFTFATVYFPTKDEQGEINGVGFIGVHIKDKVWINTDMNDMLEKAQGTILDLQKRVDDMRLQATTDPLTGVWNRIQAEVIGRQEMAQQDRSHHPVTIIFGDIDHFKNVNDIWGHSIGDQVLIEFCRIVESCLRSADVLARWGGEEFIIILPDTDLENAGVVAERIREKIENHYFPHIESLTASFGVATYRKDETWHQWVERADSALYTAKSQGRNQVELDRIEEVGVSPEKLNSSGFLRLSWRQGYESGHPVVDRQHRELFTHSNNLLSALLAEKPKSEITALINTLINGVVEHFRDEEKIFGETGFPDAAEHTRMHNRLIRKAKQIAKRYDDGNLEIGELFSFLAYDVVAMHMLMDDRKFFPYVNEDPDSQSLLSPTAKKTSPASGRTSRAPVLPVKPSQAKKNSKTDSITIPASKKTALRRPLKREAN